MSVCRFARFEALSTTRVKASELDVGPTHSLSASRFDHYQLLTREDGTLFEPGHGAMASANNASPRGSEGNIRRLPVKQRAPEFLFEAANLTA